MCSRSGELLLFVWEWGESTSAVISQGSTGSPHCHSLPGTGRWGSAVGPSMAQEQLCHRAEGWHSLWGGTLQGRELWHPRAVGQDPIFLAAKWQRLRWQLPWGFVRGWHCSMSPHGPVTLWCKGCPWPCPWPSCACGVVLSSRARLLPTAPPGTLRASPAPGTALPQRCSGWAAAAGLGRHMAPKGTVPALLPSRGRRWWPGAVAAAPAGLFSSLLGGESGQEIKGRPRTAGHCESRWGLEPGLAGGQQ